MSRSERLAEDETKYDSLAHRFRDSLSCKHEEDNNSIYEKNKPDYRELDLGGSPVSTLKNRASVSNGVTSSSSSSSSSGSVTRKSSNNTQLPKQPDDGARSHSGELSGLSETSPAAPEAHRSGANTSNLKPGHRRSVSAGAPLIYSGSSFGAVSSSHCSGATSAHPNSGANLLPSGNICPSGKILKTGMASRSQSRSDTLAKGTGNYGHGSIMRAGGSGRAKLGSGGNLGGDAEELKRAGNEMYKKGNFVEALALYDKTILLSPENATYRSNRAATLTALGRLGEAVRECEEAVKLDPSYGRAHQRLGSLYLRLGWVEDARRHLCFHGQQPDTEELHKLQSLEKQLKRCSDARKIGDWKSTVRESDAAITMGADYSPQIVACKAEALLKLHQIQDAESTLSNIPKLEHSPLANTKFFGMVSEAYVLYVQSQLEMALGRFENAVSAAEKAVRIDYTNIEIAKVLNNVKMVGVARTSGNDLFNAGRYAEACAAYGEGLKYDIFNSVLYCNRAVCWSKLGLWEKSIEDCNQALRIHHNYTKALLRRAVSNEKLERWVEAVRDYEVLRKELPGDNEVSESLRCAKIALKKCRGADVNNMKVSGVVEEIRTMDKFKAAISLPG
ncbi:inactive TPR repeat-containing thioredoxin TTL3-like isoform X2 [Tripterygium wilfordii]|nr:inactive TPR repeat-containing thioredoxin TTL3-like isoform X2 [Tripterygium wilfordii]